MGRGYRFSTMIKIQDYMLLSLEQRQAHLKLNEDCIERGGNPHYFSTEVRGLLADTLDTTLPSGMRLAHACHACNNNRCSNKYHLYWGTPRENKLDADRCGANGSIWNNMVKKYGLEEARRIQSQRARISNKNRHSNTNEKIAKTVKIRHQEGRYKNNKNTIARMAEPG